MNARRGSYRRRRWHGLRHRGFEWVARCVIPNGTVIPNRGHYLCVNSVGYSLASIQQVTEPPRPVTQPTQPTFPTTRYRALQYQRCANFISQTASTRRLDLRSEHALQRGHRLSGLVPSRSTTLSIAITAARVVRSRPLAPARPAAMSRTATTTPRTSSSSILTVLRQAPVSVLAHRDRRTSVLRSNETLRSR
jgi:hypothetical protein